MVGQKLVKRVGVVSFLDEFLPNFTQYLFELAVGDGLLHPMLRVAVGGQGLLECVTKLHGNDNGDTNNQTGSNPKRRQRIAGSESMYHQAWKGAKKLPMVSVG